MCLFFFFSSLLLEHPLALSDRSALISQGLPQPPYLVRNSRDLVQRSILLQKTGKQEETSKCDQSTNVVAWVSAT